MSSTFHKRIDDNATKEYLQIYPIFKDRLSQEEFISLVGNLNWEDGSFLRAPTLFVLSQKCAQCERTLTIALLCSSVEAMTPKNKQVDFFAWLVKNKCSELSLKNEKEMRDTLQSLHEEWLKQPFREGAFFNFRQFLSVYCPKELRTPPIEGYKGNAISFEEALRGIYNKFRSLFLHEGFSWASYEVPSQTNLVEVKGFYVENGHLFFIDLIKIVPWFSTIVKESLYSFLTKI